MSTTQQGILSDPTNLKTQGSPTANKIYERTDNMIGFYETCTIREASHGLAKMGYNVLVVNAHDEYPDHGRKEPRVLTLPESYQGKVHVWSQQEGAQNLGNCLEYFSEVFDYVLIDIRHTSEGLTTLGYMLTRLIISHKYQAKQWTAFPDISSRTFMVTCYTRPPFLYMNDLGAPEGIVRERYMTPSALWEGINVPLITSCYPGVDQVEFAKAILGTGDPRRVFVTQKNIKSKEILYRYAYLDVENVLAGALTISAVSIGALAGFNDVGFISDSLAVWLMSSFGIGMSAALGSIPRLRQIFKKGRINSRFAKTHQIHARQDENNFPIAAPAIEENPTLESRKEFTPIGMTSWKAAEEKYVRIKTQWVDYELDVFKTLDAPLMVDYSCSETQALAQAMQRAEQAMVESQEGDVGSTTISLRQNFTEKVNALEIAFKIAEDNALRKGLSYLESSEQSKVRQARDLLRLAQDTGASDSEREVSYSQAMKNLTGIIIVTPEAQKRALESAGIRKEITQH